MTFQAHYAIKQLDSLDEIRAMFTGDSDPDLNWLFVGTSGVHGTYDTLDDIASGESKRLTILALKPRTVCVLYGHVLVNKADVPWLREHVAKTVASVAFYAGREESDRVAPTPAASSGLVAHFARVVQAYQETGKPEQRRDLANCAYRNRVDIQDALALAEAVANPDEAMVERVAQAICEMQDERPAHTASGCRIQWGQEARAVLKVLSEGQQR